MSPFTRGLGETSKYIRPTSTPHAERPYWIPASVSYCRGRCYTHQSVPRRRHRQDPALYFAYLPTYPISYIYTSHLLLLSHLLHFLHNHRIAIILRMFTSWEYIGQAHCPTAVTHVIYYIFCTLFFFSVQFSNWDVDIRVWAGILHYLLLISLGPL